MKCFGFGRIRWYGFWINLFALSPIVKVAVACSADYAFR